ncbi:MAG: ACT domain-containing protein [Deltaproteobacteria bacterium]|nr:ACT domain-containing protein [Deltaproteobacteria bacterium]
MVKTEISLFLKNAPGKLANLTRLIGEADINIEAMTIQDASSYVQELFKARGKSLQRIASVASYNSMRKDSAHFALIRIIVNNTDKAVELLAKQDYLFDLKTVITIELDNKPGELAKIATKFGDAKININYVYGSAAGQDAKWLFVFSTDDVEEAARIIF